jgi:Flp pilus assembly protein TadB
MERTPEQVARDRRNVRRLIWVAFLADVALAAVLLGLGLTVGALAVMVGGAVLTSIALHGFPRADP